MPYQVNIAVNSLTINSRKTWVGQACFTYSSNNTTLATGAIEPFALPAAFNFGTAGISGSNSVQYNFTTNTSFQASIEGSTTPVYGTLSLVGATYGSDASGGASDPVVTNPTYVDAEVETGEPNSVTVGCAGQKVTCTQLHFMFTWTDTLTTHTVYFRSADPRSTNIGSGDPHDLQNPQATNDSSAPTHL